MMILGAKGHAKDLLAVLNHNAYSQEICFYDDISRDVGQKLYEQYAVIRSKETAISFLKKTKDFALGIGKPNIRKMLAETFLPYGTLVSIISNTAIIGQEDVILGEGLNIMPQVFISNSVRIGRGTLINTAVSIHHDVTIGAYSELMPGCRILGGAQLGDMCSIGSGALVLPNVKIGNKVVVGAGAVVTKDLPDNITVAGIPAKKLV